jgi:hypothetical protein
MKYKLAFSLILITILFAACRPLTDLNILELSGATIDESLRTVESPVSETQDADEIDLSPTPIEPGKTSTLPPTPVPSQIPDELPAFYDCAMEIQFISGPLENESTQFLVLGEDYFYNKGDKFAPGKGTSVYYQEQNYFILHSGNLGGNLFNPMEAEFLRKHLEHWGTYQNQYIQKQIDELIGSKVSWVCNGEPVLETVINGIVRLSHQASNQLWLKPRELDQILKDKVGNPTEWVGQIEENLQSDLLIGFCGWGPKEIEKNRFSYYRYLISFEVLP